MKMKNALLSLSLAGLCLSQASAQVPSARHIGDGTAASSSPDQRPAEFQVGNSRLVSRSTLVDYETLAPTTMMYEDGSLSDYDGKVLSSNLCDEAAGICRPKSKKHWVTAETLLWFSQAQDSPVLATTSAQGVLPVSGAAGVNDAFGGEDGLSGGLLPGYRLSIGTYLGECDKLGVGGRVFGLYSSANEYNASSDGSTSLGVPHYNTFSGFNDVYLVGFTAANGDPVAIGDISARSDLDMVGAEASLYVLLGRSTGHRVDMVGGYTFNNLKNSVSLHTQSTNLFTGDLIPNGTVFTTDDLFETKNVFNGGHLGVLSTVVRSRVSLSTLTKVSFGNMRQTGSISGSTVVEVPGDPAASFAGGLFAQQSNIGSYSRDTFAFIPELGLKLGYSVHENLQLTVGYTFMMWSSVGLAGEQMDSSLDLTQVGNAPGTRPAPILSDSSFWMQGVDLGLNWTF